MEEKERIYDNKKYSTEKADIINIIDHGKYGKFEAEGLSAECEKQILMDYTIIRLEELYNHDLLTYDNICNIASRNPLWRPIN